jgi:hypothetical protein
VRQGETEITFYNPRYNQNGNVRADENLKNRQAEYARVLACAKEVKLTQYTSEGRFGLYTYWPVDHWRQLLIDNTNILGTTKSADKVVGAYSSDDTYEVNGLDSFYSYFGIHGWRPVTKPFKLELTPDTSDNTDNTTYGYFKLEVTEKAECIPGMIKPTTDGLKAGSMYCSADGAWTTTAPFGQEIQSIYHLDTINSDAAVCQEMGGSDCSGAL